MMLGQLPGFDWLVPTVVGAATAPPSCSWLGTTYDFFADQNAWHQCMLQNSQNQIQSVPARAATYYGPDSVTATVAQQAADIQSAQAAGDIANVGDYYKAGALIATPGNPGGIPTWALAALVVGGLLLIGRA